MGNACGNCCWKKAKHKSKISEQYIQSGHLFEMEGDFVVHMLIVAMDYKRTKHPLSCTMDAKNMETLAKACGVVDLVLLDDKQGPLTSDMAQLAIKAMLGRCRRGEYFIFYYTGHGAQLKDDNKIEDSPGGDAGEDGQDEVYCFQDASGQITVASCMTDDRFAEILTSAIPQGVKTVVLSDCCHSDTICDFGKPIWDGFDAISISGCLDHQTSGDIGTGGIFTHSMLLAIDKLCHAKLQGHPRLQQGYSVEMMYNAILQEKKTCFRAAPQEICTERTKDHKPNTMCWPLIPFVAYFAPLRHGWRDAPILESGGDAPRYEGVPDYVTNFIADTAALAGDFDEDNLEELLDLDENPGEAEDWDEEEDGESTGE